jgi:DNA-binding NarL/FixJ family response regulator
VTIRVVLADDQTLLRSTFRLLLDAAPDMEVVGEAGNGNEALEITRVTHPSIVIMDIRMPELDGIAATRAISAAPELTDVKIIMLTTFETEDLVVDALRAGASGYLSKGIEPEQLLAAIRTVAAGESLLSPSATRAVISRVIAQPVVGAAQSGALTELTPRETEILTLVGLGLSNAQIAEQLFITPVTAKTHVNRTMAKLRVRDRAQLVVIAYETGLVTPGQR